MYRSKESGYSRLQETQRIVHVYAIGKKIVKK